MTKVIAISNVVAWSGFWAFGYLALTAGVADTSEMLIAVLLAALGGGVGLWTWFQLVRHSEVTGYARPARRVFQREESV